MKTLEEKLQTLQDQIAHLEADEQRISDLILSGQMDLDDCFMTRKVNSISIRLANAKMNIIRNEGKAEFPALFNLDGTLASDKLYETKYGKAFLVELPQGQTRWIGAFLKEKTLTLKGYFYGNIEKNAWACIKDWNVHIFPSEYNQAE